MSSVLDYWRQLIQSGIVSAGSDVTVAFALPADALPLSIAAASAIGVATSRFALQDHTHAHGDQAGGALHAAVSSTAAGFAPQITGSDGYVLTKSGANAIWASPTAAAVNFRDLKIDFGAAGDGVTDDLPAFQAAVAAGGVVYVPRGNYYISDTVHINNTVSLIGENRRTAKVYVAGGKTAFIVHYLNTAPSGTGNGADSVIQGLGIWPQTATLPWSAATAVAVGAIRRPTVNAANGLVYRAQSITTGITGGVEPTWPTFGQTVVDGGVTWIADWLAGIWLKARADINDVDINNIAGHGIVIYADTSHAPPTNANNWTGRNWVIQGCWGDGVYVHGGDANRGQATGGTVGSNYGWGIHDNGFLGNKWTNFVSQDNDAGGYRCVNPNARTAFEDCYSESDEGPSQVSFPAGVIGGLYAQGFTADSTAMRFHDGRWRGNVQVIAGNSTDGYVTTDLAINNDGSHYNIWRAQDASGVDLTGVDLHFKYRRAFLPGFFSWDILNSDLVISAMIATQQQAVFPRGSWVFPLGAALGSPELGINSSPLFRAAEAPPTTGTFKAGDFYWNSGASASTIGWKCTVGGAPGTWEAVTITGGQTITLTGHVAGSGTGSFATTIQPGVVTSSMLASMTSAQLAGIISDETGSGAAVFATGPQLVTPNIGAATGASLALSGGAGDAVNATAGASATVGGIGVSGLGGAGITNGAGGWGGVFQGGAGAGAGAHGSGVNGIAGGAGAHGVKGNATTGYGVWGTASGTNGIGVLAEATSTARALQIQPPAASGPAGVRWTPQAIGNVAHIVGDAYMSASGVLRIATTSGTPGVFTAATRGPLLDVTTNQSLNPTHANGAWSNRGASGNLTHTLPASASLQPGDSFRFRVAAAFYVQIQAQGTDTIRMDNQVSVAAGFIRCNSVGATLEIEYQGNGEFWVTAVVGSWSIDL